MIIDVTCAGDRSGMLAARRFNPPGRLVILPRRFTPRQMTELIIAAADGAPASISVLRFHGVPFHSIFSFNPDSPLLGRGTMRETTPEETDVMRLNDYFVTGRTYVFFNGCGTAVNDTFLRNPTLRLKLWSRVAHFDSFYNGEMQYIPPRAAPPAG